MSNRRIDPLLEVKLKMHPDYPHQAPSFLDGPLTVKMNPRYIAPEEEDMKCDTFEVSGECGE